MLLLFHLTCVDMDGFYLLFLLNTFVNFRLNLMVILEIPILTRIVLYIERYYFQGVTSMKRKLQL